MITKKKLLIAMIVGFGGIAFGLFTLFLAINNILN
jgi:uncharacterized protein involved in exopolysaccharide biosynthesis